MESSELRSGVRRDILALLGGGPLSAPELAERLALHVTTVRFHLDRLMDGQLVDSERSSEHHVGRPRLLYRLRHQGSSAPTASSVPAPLQALALVLMSGFHPGPDEHPLSPEEAGAQWSAAHAGAFAGITEHDGRPADTPGQWLAKVGHLVDLLSSWGYAPRLEGYDGGTTADLRLLDCPFIELARADPEVVCGIHTGLIRGAMREFGEPDTEVELFPFTDPPLCRARIARRESLTEQERA